MSDLTKGSWRHPETGKTSWSGEGRGLYCVYVCVCAAGSGRAFSNWFAVTSAGDGRHGRFSCQSSKGG